MSAVIAMEHAAFVQLTAHVGSIWAFVDEAPNVQKNVGLVAATKSILKCGILEGECTKNTSKPGVRQGQCTEKNQEIVGRL